MSEGSGSVYEVLTGRCVVCGVSSGCHVRWDIYIDIDDQEVGMVRYIYIYIYIYIAIYASFRAWCVCAWHGKRRGCVQARWR